MIFAIRHGERSDDPQSKSYFLSDLTYDPPLSSDGFNQACKTGELLKTQLRINGERKIIVISSPFLRCIQTAMGISEKIGKIHKNTIFVLDEICEILKEKFFDRNVLGELYLRKDEILNNKIKIKEKKLKYLSSTSLKPKIKYPEDIKACAERFKLAKQAIENQFINDGETIVILVTHSIGVQCLFHEQLPKETIPTIGYCSVTQICDGLAGLKNYTDHLK